MISLHLSHLRIVAGVTAVVWIISCAGAPPVRDLQPVRTTEGVAFHSGIRIDREGIPLLALSGSHYEVGLQYGVLLKPEIRSIYGEFDSLLNDLTGGGLRRFFFCISLNGQIKEMRSSLPLGMVEELRGMADGSGISFSDFAFFAIAQEILFDTSCTTVVVRRGGEVAHGRNFDFFRPATFISHYPTIVRISLAGKVPYVSVGFAGIPGVYTGSNVRGISVSVNTAAFVKHSTKNVVPVGFLLKMHPRGLLYAE